MCLLDIPIGILIDRVSISFALTISLLANLLSQLIFTFMLQFRPSGYFIVLLAMRVLFGTSGESNFTAQGKIIAKYCKKNYEFVLSVCFGIGFFFNALDSLITTGIYNQTKNLAIGLFFGVFMCGLSLIGGGSLIRIINKFQQEEGATTDEAENNKSKRKSIFKEIRSFNSTFWFIIAFTFFSEASLGPFNDNLNDLLVKRFSIPYADAGRLLLIPSGGLSICSVIIGKVFTHYPRLRRRSFIFSTGLFFVTMILLYFLPNT